MTTQTHHQIEQSLDNLKKVKQQKQYNSDLAYTGIKVNEPIKIVNRSSSTDINKFIINRNEFLTAETCYGIMQQIASKHARKAAAAILKERKNKAKQIMTNQV